MGICASVYNSVDEDSEERADGSRDLVKWNGDGLSGAGISVELQWQIRSAVQLTRKRWKWQC